MRKVILGLMMTIRGAVATTSCDSAAHAAMAIEEQRDQDKGDARFLGDVALTKAKVAQRIACMAQRIINAHPFQFDKDLVSTLMAYEEYAMMNRQH